MRKLLMLGIVAFLLFMLVGNVEGTVYLEMTPSSAEGYSDGNLFGQPSGEWWDEDTANIYADVSNGYINITEAGSQLDTKYNITLDDSDLMYAFQISFNGSTVDTTNFDPVLFIISNSGGNDRYNALRCDNDEDLVTVSNDLIQTDGCLNTSWNNVTFFHDWSTNRCEFYFNGVLKQNDTCESAGEQGTSGLWFRTQNNQGNIETYIRHVCSADNTTTECFADVAERQNFPNSIYLDTGTLETGDNESCLYDDTDYFNVSEVVGTPAFLFNFTFDNWTAFDTIFINEWYEGNVAHNVDVLLWNSTDWIDVGTIVDGSALSDLEISIADYTDYNISGNVTLAINHTSAGNTNHWLAIDYIRLAGVPEVTLHDSSGYYNSSPLVVNLTVTDLNDTILNCSVYNGTTLIGSNATVQENVTTQITTNATTDGNYSSVYVECYDLFDGDNSSTIWMYLDVSVSGLTVEQATQLEYIYDNIGEFIMSALLLALVAIQALLFWMGEKSENVGMRIVSGMHLVLLGFYMVFTYKDTGSNFVEIIGAVLILLGGLLGIRGAVKG